MISLGIEELLAAPPAWLGDQRLGLLCNQASTDRHFTHSRDLIQRAFGDQLTCLFTPQHGFFCEKQDNMIESGHMTDPGTGLPVFSLYGDSRRPSKEMFAQLDVLLVDIVDVGTRVYTFLYTLAYCLEAAKEYGKKIVVLDRPNPIGSDIEGNLLKDDCRSFVGLYPIPMRHGLTFGELALLLNHAYGIGADLEVIPMAGWQRWMHHRDTGLPFVFPSPNMPTPEATLTYPGQVIWEGTNISEGRGTTLPFELFGAPFIDHRQLLDQIAHVPLPGCYLRPVVFEPTSNKWAGSPCPGFNLHVTDRLTFKPYRTALAILQGIMLLYPEDFKYKEPPYEYEYTRLPMDLILGDTALREGLEAGHDLMELENNWQEELQEFEHLRRQYFLYELDS